MPSLPRSGLKCHMPCPIFSFREHHHSIHSLTPRMLSLSKNLDQTSGISVYVLWETAFVSPLSPSYWPKRFLPILLQWLLTVSCSEMKPCFNWKYSKNRYRFWVGCPERSAKMLLTIVASKKETMSHGVHFEGDGSWVGAEAASSRLHVSVWRTVI